MIKNTRKKTLLNPLVSSNYKFRTRRNKMSGGYTQFGISSVQDQRQWASLWRLRKTSLESYYHQIVAILSGNSLLRGRNKQMLINRLCRIILHGVDQGLPDSDIYNKIATEFNTSTGKKIIKKIDPKSKKTPKKTNGGCIMEGGAAVDPKYVKTRAYKRVERFMKILEDKTPTNLLDVGCSQGKITETLGNQLGLEVGKINGCDLLPPDQIDTRGITYAQNKVDRLPYGDNEFDLVVCAMSMHHFTSPKMFEEISRVCQPGGYLLIREHDCRKEDQPWLGVVLDVMHGMWSLVWPMISDSVQGEPEDPDFCQSYWAHYRGRDEWNHLLASHGFSEVIGAHTDLDEGRKFIKDGKSNPMNVYHQLYRLTNEDADGAREKVDAKVGLDKDKEDKKDKAVDKDKVKEKKFLKIRPNQQFLEWILQDYDRIRDTKKYPHCPDYRKFHIDGRVSSYSSLLPKHIESLTEILDTWGKQEKIKRIDSVIDATAHIGCDTVFLANYYKIKSGVSFEISERVYRLLSENISRAGLDHIVKASLGSCVNGVSSLTKKYDMLYLDPPWGGRNYRAEVKMNLSLDDVPVTTLIHRWLTSDRCEVLIYKTPLNIDQDQVRQAAPLGWKVECENIIDSHKKKESFMLWLFYKS